MDWSPVIAWGGFFALFGVLYLFFKWYLRDQQPHPTPRIRVPQREGERVNRSPLPAFEPPVAPPPDELGSVEWLHIVTNEPDKAPHILIAGESGTGKTTVAQAMLTKRGGMVAIADPKPTRPGAHKWGGLESVTIDTDGSYRSIEALFAAVLQEVDRRLATMRTSHEPFEPLTIVADEWLTLLAKCPSAVKLYEIANIGRELGMRLIILSISDQVKSLKLDGRGDLRENFRFVRLGDKALAANPDTAHQERPACLEWRGKNVLIDVENLDTMARHSARRVQVWSGVQTIANPILDELLAATHTPDGAAHLPNDGAQVRASVARADAVRAGASVLVRDGEGAKTAEPEADAPTHHAPHENPHITPDELRRITEAVKMVGAGESMTAALCKAFETTKGSGNPKWKRARWLWEQAQAEEVEV